MELREYVLGDICDRLSSGKGIPAKEVHDEGEFPVYGGNGLRGYTDHKNFEGDCGIIGRQGAFCGNVRYFSGEAYMTEHAVVVQAAEGFNTHYLTYLLSTMNLGRLSGQSAQPGLSVKTLAKQIVKIPDYETQCKVSAILRIIDNKIGINECINKNLQQQAALIFTEWLSCCTERTTIGDMSNNILDYSPTTSEMIRLLNSSDVTEGVFPTAPLVPNKDLKGHFKKRFRFGDILYSEIRPRNHHYGFVLFDASEYIASTRLMVIRAIDNKVSPAMLYQYLLLPEVEADFTLKTESRSGTFPQGNYADMSSIEVPYASVESQSEVSDTLSQIRYTIALNQLENQRLSELRDTLLPKLMSGELDVSELDL